MADRSIGTLDPITEIGAEDLFVLEDASDGHAKKLRGEQLTGFVNRNILHISVNTLDANQPAQVQSYDATTGTLVLGLPRGASIEDVEPISTVGLVDTYRITFEAHSGGSARPPVTFDVKNGDYITDINPIVETHTPGGFDTYEFEFVEREPIQIDVYNGMNGGGAAEYDDANEGIYIADGGDSISANAVTYDASETYDDGTVGKALQNIDFPKITNAQIDALFA